MTLFYMILNLIILILAVALVGFILFTLGYLIRTTIIDKKRIKRNKQAREEGDK